MVNGLEVNTSDYLNQLTKLIPAEIVAAYLAIDGLTQSVPSKRFLIILIVSIIFFCSIPFYLRILYKIKDSTRIALTMFSYVIWVFYSGGPFLYFFWYGKIYGSIALIIWTFFAPLFYRDGGQPNAS